jgi:hypothetical protein
LGANQFALLRNDTSGPTDALYFIIDQLEAFDSGPKTGAKLVERIDGIAQW